MIAVAIDGPAGAGKSSIARKVAEEIGFIYVDTGALYRSIGLHMLKKNIFPGDEQAVPRELEHIDIALEFKDGEQKEMLEKGNEADLSAILEEIKERDERDANREIAPLVPAKDAVFVDTTGMTMQEVIDKLKELIAAGAV